ncbi:hypothetical protein BK809_0007717 [Diplodia seriata]|uniref:Ubiquitin-conjugating enzyme E2-binding protein n=1 Tax=Diplodia seriata TaxID=420778 RepID=A0A1S8BJB6_9PEZI|nr:hypothetical protein BK809_0007717 [Diplodia seriata]
MSLSSPPPSSSILHLYAELLLHIRTVTFFASLRTDDGITTTTTTTRADLSADGVSVTLTHAGESASLRLPARVQGVGRGGGGGGGVLYEGPSDRAGEVSLRLRVREGEVVGGAGGGENVVPWDAGRLEEGCGRVGCRGCGEEVVKVRRADEAAEEEDRDGGGGGVKRWMDLPNENWAEMMDFWHCHKPHEHHLPGHMHDQRPDDDVGKEKGYAASNRIVAKRGVGYVDLTYLLLAGQDCSGVQVRLRSHPYPLSSRFVTSLRTWFLHSVYVGIAAGDKKEAVPESCAHVSGEVFDTITQNQCEACGGLELHTPFAPPGQSLRLLFRRPTECNHGFQSRALLIFKTRDD